MVIVDAYKQETSEWAGGLTRELYKVHSTNSLQYDTRISMAEINDSPSDFTSLPGIQRTLILLDGNLELEHNGSRESLKQFGISKFLGDWKTRSYGRARVLNIMSPKNIVLMHSIKVIDEHTSSITANAKLDALFIACGTLSIEDMTYRTNTLLILNQGDTSGLHFTDQDSILHVRII